MKNIALIGSTGSIGQEIFNQLSKKDNVRIDTFTRKNIEDLLSEELLRNPELTGTINIDYRSLYLHFECGTFLAESSTIKDIREDYEKTFKISREITESVLEGKWFDTAIAAILRVFSPIV